MSDLFTIAEPEGVVEQRRNVARPNDDPRPFDAYLAVARRKLGVGPEWEIFAWECIDRDPSRIAKSDVLVRGAVPFLSPRGKKRWPKMADTQRAVITAAEWNAARAEYEAESGLCADCGGTGQTLKSASVRTGELVRAYRDCSRCKATGSPSSVVPDQGGAK